MAAPRSRSPWKQDTRTSLSFCMPTSTLQRPNLRAPLGLEGRRLLVPPTEVHLIDYVQIAVHFHATIKLLIVPVGVTDTECICVVPELTSKQNAQCQGWRLVLSQWKLSQQEMAGGHTPPRSGHLPSVWRALDPSRCCCWVSAPLCTVVGNCNLTWTGNFYSSSLPRHHCWGVSGSRWHGVFKFSTSITFANVEPLESSSKIPFQDGFVDFSFVFIILK